MKGIFKDRFSWYAGVLVVFIGILSVYGANVPAAQADVWQQVYIPLQRLAFSVAVLVSRWRG